MFKIFKHSTKIQNATTKSAFRNYEYIVKTL